ncbi:MAG: TIGR00304 family membrane protein [Candidatus Alkanophagales archaeon]
MEMFRWWLLGFALVLLGTLIIFAGTLYEGYKAVREAQGRHWHERGHAGGGEGESWGDVSGGAAGVVMIGPFPIVFGTDVAAVKLVIVLTLVLMVVAFVLLLLSVRLL